MASAAVRHGKAVHIQDPIACLSYVRSICTELIPFLVRVGTTERTVESICLVARWRIGNRHPKAHALYNLTCVSFRDKTLGETPILMVVLSLRHGWGDSHTEGIGACPHRNTSIFLPLSIISMSYPCSKFVIAMILADNRLVEVLKYRKMNSSRSCLRSL